MNKGYQSGESSRINSKRHSAFALPVAERQGYDQGFLIVAVNPWPDGRRLSRNTPLITIQTTPPRKPLSRDTSLSCHVRCESCL